MVDNKSIGGALVTGFFARISEVTQDKITFIVAIAVGVTTVAYNCIKILNELNNKNNGSSKV